MKAEHEDAPVGSAASVLSLESPDEIDLVAGRLFGGIRTMKQRDWVARYWNNTVEAYKSFGMADLEARHRTVSSMINRYHDETDRINLGQDGPHSYDLALGDVSFSTVHKQLVMADTVIDCIRQLAAGKVEVPLFETVLKTRFAKNWSPRSEEELSIAGGATIGSG